MFKVGDIVQLKSGGPKMTVSEIYKDGTYGCSWFVGTDLKEASFSANALEPYEEKSTRAQVGIAGSGDPQGWMR